MKKKYDTAVLNVRKLKKELFSGAHVIGVCHGIKRARINDWRDPIDAIFAKNMLIALDALPPRARERTFSDTISKVAHMASWMAREDIKTVKKSRRYK